MLDVAVQTQLNTFELSLAFQAATGKTTVLLGESGSGKTTVLNVLAGLHAPQAGRISLDDTVYFDQQHHINIPAQARPFGYVFQDYLLFPHLTVFENVAFGLRAQHCARSLIKERVREALEQVHLTEYEQRHPAQLSGGQQQRVAIARALALQPRLLLLDEPLSALDVQTKREVRQELRRLLASTGITTILVTHQYVEALLFGQQIIVLDKGKIIQQGQHQNLLTTPRSSYVAELVGVNFFRGTIVSYEGEQTCTVQVQDATPPLQVVATLRELQLPVVGEEAFVVVDPRAVTLYLAPPESSARNLIYGEITQVLRSRGTGEEGHVLVSLSPVAETTHTITAEITEASFTRLNLHEGMRAYASFKATEASAYT